MYSKYLRRAVKKKNDIQARVFCTRSADDTVPVEFSSVKVCCADGRAGLVCDDVAPGCNLNPVWIFSSWPIINHRIPVSEFFPLP